jgi:hypothetical protein
MAEGAASVEVAATARNADAAPATITDDQIVDLVYAGLGDHTLPAPAADTLYMVFFPSTTTITAGSERSCVDFGGYHGSARNDIELAYAVIASCDATVVGWAARRSKSEPRMPRFRWRIVETRMGPHTNRTKKPRSGS